MKKWWLIPAFMLAIGGAWAQDGDDLWGDDTPPAAAPAAAAPPAAAAAPPAATAQPDIVVPVATDTANDMVDEVAEQLKILDFQVEMASLLALDKRIDAKTVAAELKAPNGVFPPRLPPDRVEAKIEAKLAAIVSDRFPDSRYAEIREEAEKKYEMYPLGARITVKARLRGRKETLTGILDFVTPERIKVVYPVAKRDIMPEYLPHLYQPEHEAAVKIYVSKLTRQYNERKAQYENHVRRKLLPAYWSRYGYFRRGKKWVPKNDFFREKYASRRDALLNQIREEIRQKVYTEAGYATDPQTGRWVAAAALVVEPTEPEAPPSVLDKLRTFLQEQTGGATDAGGDDAKATDAGAPDAGGQAPTPTGGDEEGFWDEAAGDTDQAATPAPEPAPAPAAPPPDAAPAPKDDVSDLFDED